MALNRHYVAVQIVGVRRAFCLLCKSQAEVVEVNDGLFSAHDFDGWLELSNLKRSLGEAEDSDDWIRSVNFEIQVPRVIRLVRYDRVPKNTVKFNRRNILLRDENRCQYCSKRYPTNRLSLDHIHPRSRGGEDSWENIVCACLTCNIRKGGRTPHEAGMKLCRKPFKPAHNPLLARQLNSRKYSVWRHFVPNVEMVAAEADDDVD